MNVSANPKTTVYVGGLDDSVNEAVLHAAFIPFGDIKDVNIPLDQTTQSNRGFGFITYLEKADAAAAMDNMHNSELYGKVLRVNFAQPMKIKGGEKGWSHQPVWADSDAYMETQNEDQAEKVEAEDKRRRPFSKPVSKQKLLQEMAASETPTQTPWQQQRRQCKGSDEMNSSTCTQQASQPERQGLYSEP